MRLSHVDAKLTYVAKVLAGVAGDQATLCAEHIPSFPAPWKMQVLSAMKPGMPLM
ncbi:MAG: hypothetical protein CBARDCOR_1385 [uncultured Caballeronia sp.]|nr:MAG: hypothetical protein CBARDCOR_1385 [uncultured Caballeronia sp.]